MAVSCHSMAVPAHKDDDSTLVAAGLRALAIESRALAALQLRVGSAFAAACRLCLACTGRVVVSGMGGEAASPSAVPATPPAPCCCAVLIALLDALVLAVLPIEVVIGFR